MNFIHTVYSLVGLGCACALIPPLWLYYRFGGGNLARFYQRLGVYPLSLRRQATKSPCIWLHAVSVGEVGVAAAIIKFLDQQMPPCQIVISTATEQGLAQARAQLKARATCIYAPLDLHFSVSRALKTIRPDVLALLETEIWPNLIVTARRMGVRTTLLNGRISVRTIKGYRRIRPLMRHTLQHVDVLSLISTADASRFLSLGAPANRLAVNGNAKFDLPDPHADQAARQWATTVFDLKDTSAVFVAGSTRGPEEQTILEAYGRICEVFPQAVLIIAPRHTARVAQIEQWIQDRGLTCQRRTELDDTQRHRTAPVVILDTIGELSAVYSVASFVFCGGSLVPKGGQNLLEPAIWGKPVMYGPSMEDFSEAQALIESAGGGVTVHNAEKMASVAIEWLNHPEKASSVGRSARHAIYSHRGAARKHAEVLARLVKGKN